MIKKLIPLLLISLTLAISSCNTLKEVNIVPTLSPPEKPVMTGQPRVDSIIGMKYYYLSQKYFLYTRYYNKEISYKQFKESSDKLQKKLEDIQKIIAKAKDSDSQDNKSIDSQEGS